MGLSEPSLKGRSSNPTLMGMEVGQYAEVKMAPDRNTKMGMMACMMLVLKDAIRV
jgi:hypothetical protein